MNYGKFFRLNQRTSKIEEGISIYDYIDLPAYFESSESNEMSPKYPISATITEYSIRFRVHYSAYRVNKGNNLCDYLYNVKDAFKVDKNTEIRHMEEVILELPFSNDSTDDLYNIIKDVYITRYPILDVEKDGNERAIRNYIYNLIIRRYEDVGEVENTSITQSLYNSLHVNCDSDSSYSTLWLMGLVKNNKYNLTTNTYDNKTIDAQLSKNIDGFLRKLLLDFMFDLKHSDVFQTSKYYQAMYSGLMSNFYFSALLHKCEYYFYRSLITDLIKRKITEEKTLKQHICGLYAKALFDAESLWIHDIMAPSAEKYFEHYYVEDKVAASANKTTGINEKYVAKKNFWSEMFSEINAERKRYTFRSWNSWFASPEEEMRRVYFTMKEDARIQDDCNTLEHKDEEHICNAEVITEYLSDSEKKIDEKLILHKDKNKSEVSQWFLKRYALRDVMHLHLFKYISQPIFITLCVLLFCIFVFPDFFDEQFWMKWYCAPIIIVGLYIELWTVWALVKYDSEKRNGREKEFLLVSVRRKMIIRRTKAILGTLLCFLVILGTINPLANRLIPAMSEVGSWGTSLKIFIISSQIVLIGFCGYYIFKKYYPVHWLSNMHVFFPRLIASIAAAWLTLVAGNDLFVAFFDSIVSWSTSIWLSVIVFIFVMYEINKMLPLESTFNKIGRCFGIMSVSYAISLIVGMYVINFMGERMLERGDALKDYFKHYVYTDDTSKQVENKTYWMDVEPSRKEIEINEDTHDKILLDELQYVHIRDKDIKTEDMNHPIVTTWGMSGKAKFFILRDFLIQFAFVAMFIGIFIQMLFEEKSITEI